MPVADYAQNVQTPFFPMVRHTMDWKPGKSATAVASNTTPATTAKSADAKTADASDDKGGFWHDVLDVINPLQHLPVVGTIYRAITGDKIGDVEKIAGDTLYGGPLGLASSVADLAFEKLTGKDFGDTVMGWVGLGHDDAKPTSTPTALAEKGLNALPPRVTPSAPSTIVATAAPAKLTPPMPVTANPAKPVQPEIPTLTDAQAQALMAKFNQNGVDTDLGMRALFAYQKSLALTPDGASPAP
ncbi:MAG TPA: hypothetical protein VGF56_15750 [Rhizomicrobium sp.]|jgi:hypothetical protein